MTDPCREQVAKQVKTLLESITGLTAARNRRTAISEKDMPIAVLFEGDEEDNTSFTGENAYVLPLLIQVAVNLSGEKAAAACNNWRAALTKAFLADRTLGGLVRDLNIVDPGDWIGVDVDADDAEGFLFGLRVQYATLEGDPFTFFN